MIKKFTLIELLIDVPIIGILVSLLLPSLDRARQKAKTLVCLSNLSQIGKGITIHLNNSDGRYPYDSVKKNTEGHSVGTCSAAWLGIFTPLISPSCLAHMPAALTTVFA